MSSLRVHIEAEAGGRQHTPAVRLASVAALRHQGRNRGELTVLLTSDDRLHQLNLEFRGRDQPTDVLSFPAKVENPESGLPYLGDLAVSLEAVARQAEEAGHSQRAELLLLTVHGVLHLLGHDHNDPQDRARMEAAQAEILQKLAEPAAESPER